MRTESPRPSFLVPRVLNRTGHDAPVTGSYTNVTGPLHDLLAYGARPESEMVAAWWAALEPAIVPLTLAGYDCPEIALAHWQVSDQYVRLLAWQGRAPDAVVAVQSGDWRSLFPLEGDDQGKMRFALRVEARRSVEQPLGVPSPYPPLPLAGVLPTYTPGLLTPDGSADDPFATPSDGWIVGSQPITTGVGPQRSTLATARDLRNAVAAALAAKLKSSAGAPVGLVGCLDPSVWDIPLAQALPIVSFSDLASQIWAWLSQPDNLEDLLKLKLNEHRASGEKLLKAQLAKTDGAWANPRTELEARQAYFYPREQNLATLLSGLEREHWLIALFMLHEYGLIRILPFPVTDPSLQPDPGVVADLPPTDLTGLYETRWGEVGEDGRLVNATLQINHAGAYLDGWLTDHDLFRVDYTAALDTSTFQPSAGVEQPTLRFTGRFAHDAGTQIAIADVPYPDDGSFDAELTLTFDDGLNRGVYTMTRRDRLPRLAPWLASAALPEAVQDALATSPVSDNLPEWADQIKVAESLITPLHTHHQTMCDAARRILRADLHHIFEKSLPLDLADTDERMREALTRAEILTNSELPDPVTPLLLRFQIDTQLALASMQLEPGTTYWIALDDDLAQLALIGSDAGAGIQELLDVAPGRIGFGSAGPPALEHIHEYDYQFTGYGAGGELPVEVPYFTLNGGMFKITCDLTHHEECAEPNSPRPHGWSETYGGALFEGEAALESGQTVNLIGKVQSDPNTLVTRGEWSRDDFAPCQIVSGTVSVSLADYLGGGGEVTPGNDDLFGDYGGLEQEVVVFITARGRATSEISPNNGWSVKTGVGVGASAACAAGASLGFLVKRGSDVPSRPITVEVFEGSFAADSSLTLDDFAVGDWALTPGMCAQIAQNAARYLALLASPEALVRIEGDASPTGTDPENEVLSWRRSLATYAWLRVLLSRTKAPPRGTGSGLALTAEHVEVIGNGELVARTQGQVPDGIEDARWRRVKFVINDQVMVFL
jgi:hypothetical protein